VSSDGCGLYRDAISARIDGESGGVAEEALAVHLAACAACRTWESAALAATRRARVRAAEPVPDLSGAILAAMRAEATRARPTAAAAGVPSVIRLALALVAAAQVLVAAPALVGNDLGASLHVAHEQGSWGLALAAALALAAWRPGRAAALLPFLGVFVASMSVLTLGDVLSGRVAPSAELPHLMVAFGLVLAWLETHPPAGLAVPAPAPPRHRVAA